MADLARTRPELRVPFLHALLRSSEPAATDYVTERLLHGQDGEKLTVLKSLEKAAKPQAFLPAMERILENETGCVHVEAIRAITRLDPGLASATSEMWLVSAIRSADDGLRAAAVSAAERATRIPSSLREALAELQGEVAWADAATRLLAKPS
jgi:hypothetical protein